MKVLHIVNGNDNGGATTQVATLIEAQKKHCEVEVLCLNYGKIVGILERLNIKYAVMDFSVWKTSAIIKYVAQKAAEGILLHAHGLKPMIILDKFMKSPHYDKAKMKLAATIHSNYHKEYSRKYIVKFFAIPTFIKVCKKIDIVIVVSEEFREILIADGVEPSKIHYIENGISMDRPIIEVDKKEFLMSKGIDLDEFPEDLLIYGLVARIHAVKGIDVLIEAVNLLKGDFLVLIAGDGEQALLESYKQRVLELHLSDKIKFLGYIDEISNFYQCIDVNLICSYSEALSYSALEGAYHKKPLICTKVQGLANVLEHEKDAFIAEIGDYKQIAQYMELFMKHRELMSVMGEHLNTKISEVYDSDKMFEKYDRAYGNSLIR